MADPNRKPAALSNYALDQTILFLRPITADAILDVNAKKNDRYRFKVAPSEEPTDPLVEEAPVIEKISEVTPQSHTPVNTALLREVEPPLTSTLLLSGLGLIRLKIHLGMDLQLEV